MMQNQSSKARKRQKNRAVRNLLDAVDKGIVAARQAVQARNELAKLVEETEHELKGVQDGI